MRMELPLQVVFCLVYLLINSEVNSEDLRPTFKYVTSYNRDGRFMTPVDIQKTSVNVLKPIIFIIDGLTNEDKGGDSWSRELQNAYLEKFIHNVFIVDWDLTSPSDSASINRAHSVGLAVADFIETIFNKTGESYLEIHLVGVSLGYEVAGSASRRLSKLSGRKINRITGLDPAYYLINDETDSEKLSEGNAEFVDVVHSNLNRTAGLKQIGNVDFYVDGVDENCDVKGSTTCNGILKLVTLFSKSINLNNIKARKCDSLENFRQGKCDGEEEVSFGENVSKGVRGKYFLKY